MRVPRPAPTSRRPSDLGRIRGLRVRDAHRALEAGPRNSGLTEGLVLDPVYTAKALGGLIGEVEAGRVRHDDPVVFGHTGGTPPLFPDPALSVPPHSPKPFF